MTFNTEGISNEIRFYTEFIFSQMILQEVEENHPKIADEEDVLFFVRRWYPSTMTLGEFQEVCLSRKLISDLTRKRSVLSVQF